MLTWARADKGATTARAVSMTMMKGDFFMGLRDITTVAPSDKKALFAFEAWSLMEVAFVSLGRGNRVLNQPAAFTSHADLQRRLSA
jgi:hypothetical protein